MFANGATRSRVSTPEGVPDRPHGTDVVALTISGLRKTYDNGKLAIDDLSLEVEQGEVLSLLGPSGCGKTTTLKCIAGLERADAGRIVLESRDVFSAGQGRDVMVPPERRDLAMVFQQYALWPHMNVTENVIFGLRMRKVAKGKAIELAENALRRVRLWNERDRRISQLSGGQQQRVALARAIAGNPKIILFDEPLSNLDARLRQDMRLELLELREALGFTAVYVTHDQEEAFSISSRIVIMNEGKIVQFGTPSHVWNEPASPFVAEFIGSTNRVHGQVTEHDHADDRAFTVRTEGGQVLAVTGDHRPDPGAPVQLYFKVGSVRITTDRPGTAPNVWHGEVTLESFQGESVLVKVACGASTVVSRQNGWPIGGKRTVYVHIPPDEIKCYRLDD
ncbi:ABC transporter ATP-binding protein [Actinophytocola sp.]|uniref:ABC transporter ATP-binding protein n=1 Tax=Actinophytocola sp. TaxID=1872138 RepID=UPI003D6AD5B9